MKIVVSLHFKTAPRGEILTSSQRMQLLTFPDDEGELIRRYTLTQLSCRLLVYSVRTSEK